ncbi:MAG: sigma-70 family RNA polymerase sigma factor [bacterium]|nr:MAG: sigma-70 family RNA polymerase sigma factor [bacterium]
MGMRTDEDLVHEALLIVCEKYKDVEFERGVLPWAYGVLDKVMSGEYRSEGRRQNLMNNHIKEVIGLHNDYESVEDNVASSELSKEIWNALDHLSNKEKKIFKLKLEGHSGDEIQKKLGISRASLDVSVFRGRKKLRLTLKNRGVI